MADKPVKKVEMSAAARAAEISNILSANTTGFSKKLAIAMAAGTSEPFVMGHGSGGLKFKVGGYGRIHGLGSASLDEGSGFSKKLARAMAGTSEPFVMGHGSGGAASAARAREISKILSADTAGFPHKLAIAMAGTSEPFVMGHGSGGKVDRFGGAKEAKTCMERCLKACKPK